MKTTRGGLRLSLSIAVMAAVVASIAPGAALGASTPLLPNVSAHEKCGQFVGDVAWGRKQFLGLPLRPYMEITGWLQNRACSSRTTLRVTYKNGPIGTLALAFADTRQSPYRVYDNEEYLPGAPNFGHIMISVCSQYGGGSLCSAPQKVTSEPVAAPAPAPSAGPSAPPTSAAPPVAVAPAYPRGEAAGPSSCSQNGGHDQMTASASYDLLSSESVMWRSINLTGSPHAWFRVDLINGGSEVQAWSGLTEANANPKALTPTLTASAGSRLYVTGFFPDGEHCSTTLVSS